MLLRLLQYIRAVVKISLKCIISATCSLNFDQKKEIYFAVCTRLQANFLQKEFVDQLKHKIPPTTPSLIVLMITIFPI